MENLTVPMKRVLFVNPLLASHGNLSQYNVQMTRIGSLISDSFKSVVITGTLMLPQKTIRTVDGVPVIAVQSAGIPFLKHMFYALGEWFMNFEDLIDTFQPDCLVCTEDFSLSTLQGIRYGKRKGIPTLVYSGLYLNAGFPFGLPHFAFSRTIGTRIYRDASAVIAKTSSAAQFLEKAGCSTKKIQVIPPTINTSQFQSTEPPHWMASLRESNKKLILFVGELTSNKNPVALIETLAKVRETKDVVLLMIVTDGPKAAEVAKAIRKNNLRPYVKILKNVPLHDMPSFYSAADVLMSLSGVEIFGMSILESLSCGTPVVSTPTAGPADMIVDGLNGYLAKDFTSEAIADALLMILDNESGEAMSSAEIRSSIEGRFDEHTVAGMWRCLLATVLDI
ncbi:MAG: glycosyltransferase family 4 protein [Candidatus Thorarchaeota archaeon]